MGDCARNGASDKFITEFGADIERAQSPGDGSVVDMNDSFQVVYAMETNSRRYVSETIIFEPDADEESNLDSLLSALGIEEGTSDYEKRRRVVVQRMTKIGLYEGEEPDCCAECGEPLMEDPDGSSGVLVHDTEDGHERDWHHVPYR